MTPIKRILAPVDFSPGSEAAARHAAALAHRFSAELMLLHVAPTMEQPDRRLSKRGAEERQMAQLDETRRLEGLLAALGDRIRVNGHPQTVLAEGDPVAQVISSVRNHEIGLLVIATHGLGSFRRFLLGSLTAKLLHDLEIPVLTGVHLEHPVAFHDAYQRIGCAVGMRNEEHSAAVLRWAADLADQLSAGLTVIHSPHAVDVVSAAYSADAAIAVKRDACRRVNELISHLGLKADIEIVEGDPVPAIAEAAAAARCDALVIGRSTRHGLFGAGHADGYAIVRRAPCPVFSVSGA